MGVIGLMAIGIANGTEAIDFEEIETSLVMTG